MVTPMGLGRRAIGRVRALTLCFPFEAGVLALALVYVALHLSPSSYALALDQLGEEHSPLLGSPRALRTDEWAVTTPLFQAAERNGFHEINHTSFYGETLRSFIGLPLLNWGLPFKPLVMPFFVVSPEIAYSFFWAASAALFLVGWSLLLRELGFSRLVAALGTLLLYFTPFVQVWSGTPPQCAFFPWIVLAVVRIKSPLRLAVALALLVPTWLLSTFYVPALPPLVFLGIALCLAFKLEVFAWRRIAAVAVGSAVGGAVTLFYYAPVLRAYASSEYPGQRWIEGGAMPVWQVASQFLPSSTTEGYNNLIAANVAEAATVATWLPLLAVCIVDIAVVRRTYGHDPDLRRQCRAIGILLAMWALLTAWQLLPLLPLSYAFGLGLSPEARTLFASGVLLLLAAAYAVDRLPIRVTPGRLSIFTGLVLASWLLASGDLHTSFAARDELLVVPIVLAVAGVSAISKRRGRTTSVVAVMLIALVPSAIAWGLYNPVERTDAIFRKPVTAVTRELDALAATHPDGSIAVFGFADAVLNGAGYRSVTHVLTKPSPELLRPYFAHIDEARFDMTFNRFAHILLTRRRYPYVTGNDVVRVPIRTMARFAATR